VVVAKRSSGSQRKARALAVQNANPQLNLTAYGWEKFYINPRGLKAKDFASYQTGVWSFIGLIIAAIGAIIMVWNIQTTEGLLIGGDD